MTEQQHPQTGNKPATQASTSPTAKGLAPGFNGALEYEPSKVAWATSEFIRTPPSLVSRTYIYILSLMIIVALIFCSIYPVAVPVAARGSIVTEKQVFPIRAPTNMKVGQLLIVNNQTVKKGDLIIISEEQLSQAQYDLILYQKDWMLNWLKKDSSGRCGNCIAQLREFSETAFQVGNKSQLREILSPVQELVRELATNRQQLENLPTVTASIQNQIRQAQKKLHEIQKRHAEKILAVQVEQLNNEIISGKSQIAEKSQLLTTLLESTVGKLEVKLANLKSSLDRYRSQYTLSSPEDGTITQLKISGPGQYLTEGQELMSLVPTGTVFMAELLIANRDISRVKPGLTTILNLDSLPEREFGALSGKIKTVTTLSMPTGSDSPSDGSYRVLVTLSRQSMKKDGVDYSFRIGMALSGYVITEYRTLISLALRKFFNLKDDILRN